MRGRVAIEDDCCRIDGLSALIENAPDTPLPDNMAADDPCLIVYTSGTTGFPKWAVHSLQSFILCGEAVVQRMFLHPEERILIVLPISMRRLEVAAGRRLPYAIARLWQH